MMRLSLALFVASGPGTGAADASVLPSIAVANNANGTVACDAVPVAPNAVCYKCCCCCCWFNCR